MIKKIIKVISDAKWLVAGNLVYAFSQWMLVVILAKFGTTKTLGQYTLAFAIVSPVFIFTNMQLRSLIIADNNKEYHFLDFLSLRFFLSVMGLVVCFILAFFYQSETLIIVLLVTILRFIESIVDIYHAIFNRDNKLYFIGFSLFIKGTLSFFSFLFFIYVFNSIYLALSVTAILWIALFFIFDFRNINKTKNINYYFKSDKLNKLFRQSLPLGVTVMLISLQTNIPRYFIEQYEGFEKLGIFGALSYFVVAGGVFVVSMGQSITPKILDFMNNKAYENIKSLVNMMIGFIFVIAVFSIFIFYLFGSYIVGFLYGESYAVWNNILIFLMIAGFISYMASIVGYAITALGIIKEQLYVFLILLCMSGILSYIFIPQFGLYGAAFVMMMISVIQLIMTYSLLIRRLANEY